MGFLILWQLHGWQANHRVVLARYIVEPLPMLLARVVFRDKNGLDSLLRRIGRDCTWATVVDGKPNKIHYRVLLLESIYLKVLDVEVIRWIIRIDHAKARPDGQNLCLLPTDPQNNNIAWAEGRFRLCLVTFISNRHHPKTTYKYYTR